MVPATYIYIYTYTYYIHVCPISLAKPVPHQIQQVVGTEFLLFHHNIVLQPLMRLHKSNSNKPKQTTNQRVGGYFAVGKQAKKSL